MYIPACSIPKNKCLISAVEFLCIQMHSQASVRYIEVQNLGENTILVEAKSGDLQPPKSFSTVPHTLKAFKFSRHEAWQCLLWRLVPRGHSAQRDSHHGSRRGTTQDLWNDAERDGEGLSLRQRWTCQVGAVGTCLTPFWFSKWSNLSANIYSDIFVHVFE